MALIDYEEAAPRYDAARGLALDGLLNWREAITPFISAVRKAPVVDVGAGTGQWAEAFAALVWRTRDRAGAVPTGCARNSVGVVQVG